VIRARPHRLQEHCAFVNSGNPKAATTVAIRYKAGTIAGTIAVTLAFFSGTANAQTMSFNQQNSDPNSYVYHVAIYEGGNQIVSAIDSSQGIAWQEIWASDVTFGTITH
jgi:hypothetical protein